MDIWALKKAMAQKGYTQKRLSEEIGIAPSSFVRKYKNDTFTIAEAKEIVELLEIENPTPIFFDE